MKTKLLIILFLLMPCVCFSAVEDFSTYTEVDSNSRITVTSTRASRSIYQTNTGYVYKDFGADYFDEFTHQFTTNFNTYANYYQRNTYWAVSDSADSQYGTLLGEDKGLAVLYGYYGASYVWIYNYNGDGNDNMSAPASGTTLYVTVVNSSGTATAYFYSDSDRTTLVDSLSVSNSDTFRYVSPLGDGGQGYYYGYTENLDLGSVSASTYFPFKQFNHGIMTGVF